MDVFLVLTRGDEILLALRSGTGYADGLWNLPSGKLEHEEDARTAMIREAHEEIGLHLVVEEVHLASTIHHRNPTGTTRVGLVFTTAHDPATHGIPLNAEPHKCAGIAWFRLDELPPDTDRYSVACVQAFRDNVPFALSGFTETP
ncbi:NUDIX domain-containing protein [Paractinoplanes durhamensis]|uniref:NUDIX domain-containing protein n=1 Tax=Paractinoplanes durhamensis TaxID=113563 RepID=UPI00363B21D9